MKSVFTFILVLISFTSFSQTKNSLDTLLTGKWKVISKIEIEKSEGKIIDQEQEIYKPDEKSFEFTPNKTVIITQEFGKNSEKLPVSMQGNNLYIGKPKKNKVPYLVRYDGNQLKLAKTESKTKKGKTILKTEQVVLQKQ